MVCFDWSKRKTRAIFLCYERHFAHSQIVSDWSKLKITELFTILKNSEFQISKKKIVKGQLLYKLQIHVSNDTIFISVTILKQVATKKSQQQLYNLSNLMILITILQFPVADLPFLIAALAHPIHPKLENKNKIPSKKCLPPWKVNQLHLFSES